MAAHDMHRSTRSLRKERIARLRSPNALSHGRSRPFGSPLGPNDLITLQNWWSGAGPDRRPFAFQAAGGPVVPSRGAAVGQDLVHRVAPGDPGDAAAAVCGGARLVQAADRGAEVRVAGGGAGVEHLAQAQF